MARRRKKAVLPTKKMLRRRFLSDLYRLRRRYGMSMAAMADVFGVTGQTWSKWERWQLTPASGWERINSNRRGAVAPPPTSVVLLCDVLLLDDDLARTILGLAASRPPTGPGRS